jgi:hypothetical protein
MATLVELANTYLGDDVSKGWKNTALRSPIRRFEGGLYPGEQKLKHLTGVAVESSPRINPGGS